ncbi:MAG: hypothetical protein ABIK97_06750 [candidate division WOR-3 bacterium]
MGRFIISIIILTTSLLAQHFERWVYLPDKDRWFPYYSSSFGWDGQEKLYIGGSGSDSLERSVLVYNLRTDRFKGIPIREGRPVEYLVYNPRTNLTYAFSYGDYPISVIDCERDTFILDLPYYVKIPHWPLPPGFVVNSLDNKLYFGNRLDNGLYILSGSHHNVLRTYPREFLPVIYDSINNKIGLIREDSLQGMNFYLLDGRTDELIDSCLFSRISFLQKIVFNQNNKIIYFLGSDSTTNNDSLWVYSYDMTWNRVLDSLQTPFLGGFYLWFLDVNTINNKVYLGVVVEDSPLDYLFYILSESLRVIDSITDWWFPNISFFNPQQNILYIPDADRIHLIDGETNRLSGFIPLNEDIDELENFILLPRYNLFYLKTSYGLSVIDLERRSLIKRIKMRHTAEWNNMTYNPLTERLYCTVYPGLSIIDEPTGNLDPMISLEIIRLFQEINDKGTTVIMATHNHNLVNKLRKRVVALVEGKIIKDEPFGTYAYE